MIKQLEEKDRIKKQLDKAAKKEEEEYRYYSKHFEEIMVQKIDNGEDITEKELKEICFEMTQIEERENGDGRWTRSISTVVRMCDRNFCINWQKV